MKKYLINSIYLIIILVVGLFIGHSIGQTDESKTKSIMQYEIDNSVVCIDEIFTLTLCLLYDLKHNKDVRNPLPYSKRDKLLELGFKDPVNEIISDLKKHPELIPYPGVLGGTMFFTSKVRVINSERVLARFEDGHIGGWAYYSYEISDTREITWKLIYAYEHENPIYPENWK